MPKHSHPYDCMWTKAPSGNQLAWGGGGVSLDYRVGLTTGEKGGGSAHSNLQPYVVVYMWKRTA